MLAGLSIGDRLARKADSLDAPDGWQLLGRLPFEESSENGQFLHVDGRWRLVIQTPAGQHIGAMRGDGSQPGHWLGMARSRDLDTWEFPSGAATAASEGSIDSRE